MGRKAKGKKRVGFGVRTSKEGLGGLGVEVGFNELGLWTGRREINYHLNGAVFHDEVPTLKGVLLEAIAVRTRGESPRRP